MTFNEFKIAILNERSMRIVKIASQIDQRSNINDYLKYHYDNDETIQNVIDIIDEQYQSR